MMGFPEALKDRELPRQPDKQHECDKENDGSLRCQNQEQACNNRRPEHQKGKAKIDHLTDLFDHDKGPAKP